MNNLILKGNVNKLQGKLKEKYGRLTDDDLKFVEGEEEKLLGKLQAKLGKTKEELIEEINQLLEGK